MIPYGRHTLDEDDIAAVTQVLRQGALTQGPKISDFEKAVAQYVGVKYAVAVSSGTAALHLACLAADVSSGDTVITTPNTFVASSNCAFYVGATPQFADIHPDSLNIDPAALAAQCAQHKRVKAIIPVHFAGLACDMPAIKTIADRSKAIVIEDASHALGGRYPQGGKIGNCAYSDMTVFSFHPVKMIASGEGGMITTNSEKLYAKLMLLRTHGITKNGSEFLNKNEAFSENAANPWYYEMQELGYNYRITDIQAALGESQLKKIDKFLKRRQEIASEYDKALSGLKFLKMTQKEGRAFSAHHLYVVRIDFKGLGITRSQLMKKLLDLGVGTQVHYIPVPQHPYYQRLGYRAESFPASKAYYEQALSLPMFAGLTPDDQKVVIKALLQVIP